MYKILPTLRQPYSRKCIKQNCEYENPTNFIARKTDICRVEQTYYHVRDIAGSVRDITGSIRQRRRHINNSVSAYSGGGEIPFIENYAYV